jgi:hypothetical protein
MSSASYKCPSCSAPLEVENRFSKVVICQYCGQTCNVSPDGLDPSGEKGQLADFESIFSIGCTGTIKGMAFKTLGRLRYKYEDGFWDEWFLSLENHKKLWLQEDEGEFTAFEKETLTSPLPPFEQIFVGSMLDVNKQQVFVIEKNDALIAGGAGELYFSVKPGMRVRCVDGNCEGRIVSIEFAPDEINLSIGDEIGLDQISIDS